MKKLHKKKENRHSRSRHHVVDVGLVILEPHGETFPVTTELGTADPFGKGEGVGDM
jgi:hypothetical protein